ncbi:uncharacterized protein LOC128857668 [Anastrepha ludens]|uniref:uncharacterized protein LOC128857668 n=1 Tax=Anastrepha ludens TaxID=28586 RepID=UPI0023AEC3B8|nr:uncharacterized protein LOC128857668 [Anastrepha ludens]
MLPKAVYISLLIGAFCIISQMSASCGERDEYHNVLQGVDGNEGEKVMLLDNAEETAPMLRHRRSNSFISRHKKHRKLSRKRKKPKSKKKYEKHILPLQGGVFPIVAHIIRQLLGSFRAGDKMYNPLQVIKKGRDKKVMWMDGKEKHWPVFKQIGLKKGNRRTTNYTGIINTATRNYTKRRNIRRT